MQLRINNDTSNINLISFRYYDDTIFSWLRVKTKNGEAARDNVMTSVSTGRNFVIVVGINLRLTSSFGLATRKLFFFFFLGCRLWL